MSDLETSEQTVWWAFRPQTDLGVFVPYEASNVHSLADLPTDDEVKRFGSPCVRVVELPGGAPGEVEGYLTDEADFYVALPVDLVRAHFGLAGPDSAGEPA